MASGGFLVILLLCFLLAPQQNVAVARKICRCAGYGSESSFQLVIEGNKRTMECGESLNLPCYNVEDNVKMYCCEKNNYNQARDLENCCRSGGTRKSGYVCQDF